MLQVPKVLQVQQAAERLAPQVYTAVQAPQAPQVLKVQQVLVQLAPQALKELLV